MLRKTIPQLKKNPSPWTDEHTKAVEQIELHIKQLPCLGLAHPKWFKIFETDASYLGYGGILKQRNHSS